MVHNVLVYGLQYATYALELALFLLLLFKSRWKRITGICVYVGGLFAVDGVARPLVQAHYGPASLRFAYFYWLTDVLLALAAFLLICAFFRRACTREEKMWRFTRLLLVSVFIIVAVISFFSLSRNYNQLFSRFIVEFQQNLYFTCLVLNTLLYLLMQQIESPDDELGLLVCGMGIQFAGPAASLALTYLTPGQTYGPSLYNFIGPLGTSGMLLTWFYAVARTPKTVKTRASEVNPSGREEIAGSGRVAVVSKA